MKIYAHRGNVSGPSIKENTIEHIQNALSKGYCVEIDVRYIYDALYLGHDKIQEQISKTFLEDSRLLVHCKTRETLQYLMKFTNIHCFFQEDEDCVYSNKNYRIVHEKVKPYKLYDKEIKVDLKLSHLGETQRLCERGGVITDYPMSLYQDERPNVFELLVLDVDGVMTNGTKCYNDAHIVIAKQFNDRDFTAIKRFKAAGIPVAFLSGDIFNRDMAYRRNIPFLHARDICNDLDKSEALPILTKTYRVRPEKICYVGDDYYDISLLNSVGFPFCPSDAASCVKKIANILQCKGGEGVVEALFEKFSWAIPSVYPKDTL